MKNIALERDFRWIVSSANQRVHFRDPQTGIAHACLELDHFYAIIFGMSHSPVENVFATSDCEGVKIWKYDELPVQLQS